MILELPAQTVELLVSNAKQHGLPVEDYVMELLQQAKPMTSNNPKPVSVTDFMQQFKPLDVFTGIDAVEYQRQIRSEWD